MATFDTTVLDALSVPLGDLISSVGRGIAEAQRDMDAASIAALQDIYISTEGLFHELQRIGYRPTWYHIPEAEGEISVALTVSGQQQTTGAGTPIVGRSKVKIYAAPVDAGYASRFNFTLQAASRVKFRIVPVPPSSAAEAMQVVPALVGMPVSDARARLTLLGISGNVAAGTADTALVTEQDPAAGSILAPGGSVSIETG
jgi:hypothetical protein